MVGEIELPYKYGSDRLAVMVIPQNAHGFYQLPSPRKLAYADIIAGSSVTNWIRLYLDSERHDHPTSIEAAASRAAAVITRLNATFHICNVSTSDSLSQGLAANIDTHDQFFQIQRTAGLVQPAVVRAILDAKVRYYRSLTLFYDECDRQLYSGIVVGLNAALAHLAGEIPSRLTVPDRPDPGRSSEAPAERWVLGHQIFAAVTQCIIIAMTAFETAMLANDVAAAGVALDLAATLLLASASAFRFTADFSAIAYRDTVRPSMAPEHVGSGFSGLLSADHRALVDLMVRTRPLMAAAAAELPDEHRRVSAALSYVYDDHKFVCARFGGDEGSSLRSDACSEVPGVVLLDRFKKARTRLLVPVAPICR